MAIDATGTPTTLGIPKFLTSADAPSGNGSNAQMDTLDALIQARVNRPAGVAAGDVPVWNGATFVVPAGSRTGANFLRDDGAYAFPYNKLNRASGLSTTASTTIQDLIGVQGTGFTVPAGTLTTSSVLRFRAVVDIINVSGVTDTYTWLLTWNGTPMAASATTSSVSNSHGLVNMLEGTVSPVSTTSAAVFGSFITATSGVPLTFSPGAIGSSTLIPTANITSNSNILRFQVTSSITSGTCSINCTYFEVTVL